MYGVCKCVYACFHVGGCTQMHVNVHGSSNLKSCVFVDHPFIYLLRQERPHDPRAHGSASLASQLAWEISSLSPKCWDDARRALAWLSVVSGDPNFSLHT